MEKKLTFGRVLEINEPIAEGAPVGLGPPGLALEVAELALYVASTQSNAGRVQIGLCGQKR